jgi:type I restriction enzyme R subunit
LIIEVDGEAHSIAADARRQAYLESLGYTVLRFPNFVVLHDIGLVLVRIMSACEGHLVPIQELLEGA